MANITHITDGENVGIAFGKLNEVIDKVNIEQLTIIDGKYNTNGNPITGINTDLTDSESAVNSAALKKRIVDNFGNIITKRASDASSANAVIGATGANILDALFTTYKYKVVTGIKYRITGDTQGRSGAQSAVYSFNNGDLFGDVVSVGTLIDSNKNIYIDDTITIPTGVTYVFISVKDGFNIGLYDTKQLELPVDTLISNSTTAPLSAAQGKKLNELLSPLFTKHTDGIFDDNVVLSGTGGRSVDSSYSTFKHKVNTGDKYRILGSTQGRTAHQSALYSFNATDLFGSVASVGVTVGMAEETYIDENITIPVGIEYVFISVKDGFNIGLYSANSIENRLISNTIDFCLFTDTHISQYAYPESSKLFEDTISTLKSRANIFAVGLGDSIQVKANQDELNEFSRLLGRLGLPFYTCLGNHDVASDSQADIDTFYTTVKDAYYDNPFSYTNPVKLGYYHVNLKGLDFIFLNQMHGAQYQLDTTQLAWLQATLNNITGTGKRLIVCSHVSLVNVHETAQATTIKAMFKTWNNNINNGKLLGVFNGHQHNNSHDVLDGINYIGFDANDWSQAYDGNNSQLAGAFITWDETNKRLLIDGVGSQNSYKFSY